MNELENFKNCWIKEVMFSELREGQVLMNVLFQYDYETYKDITGTEYDCFYDNKKINSTLNYLRKRWSNVS